MNTRHKLKRLLQTLSLFAVSTCAMANSLDIKVEGFKSVEGTTLMSVFTNQQSYDGDQQPVAMFSHQQTSTELQITLHGLAPGDYAIKLFHDKNDNGKLDTNLLGIPTESYGFSNSPKVMGPASFEDAKFTVDGDTSIVITL